MLCITMKHRTEDGDIPCREIIWHCGTQPPTIYDYEEVLLVQADGDELEVVCNTFNNLPCPKNKNVVVWTGDLASLIARNL